MSDVASRVAVGDLLLVRNAFGEDIRARALSRLEGTHSPNGKRIHNFPVVWICREAVWPNPTRYQRVPWPAEDVLEILTTTAPSTPGADPALASELSPGG